MLCFSFWLQGAWIAAELWSVLRSVPVPKRLSNEPWAEVSRLVDSFPVSWRIYLFWHGRLKSKERVVPLQTDRDILLIPTDLEQRDNTDTVAVFQRHPELQSSSETWLRIFSSLKCCLWMSWSLVLFFSVSHNRWQVGPWIKRLYGNFVRVNVAGFKCFASLSWTNPLQKEKNSCEDLCDLLIIECLSLVYCIEDIVSFQPWSNMTEVCETNESSGLCWSQATTELVTLWEFGHSMLHSTNYQKTLRLLNLCSFNLK